MTHILGLSGRKQSGKNTVCNFLHGMEMLSVGLISDFKFDDSGKLIVPTTTVDGQGNEKTEYGVFDLERDKTDPNFFDYMANTVWPFIKAYSFADILKMKVCVDILGLKYEQCYGTDEEKNTESNILWSVLPTSNTEIRSKKMTAREVMQYIGTDIFRTIYPDVWADSTIRRITAEGTALAVVTDVRFPNEVKAIQDAGGKVIRLTRNSESDDQHSSEVALDKEQYDWESFDEVIDNKEMAVSACNELVYSMLQKWGWVEGYEFK